MKRSENLKNEGKSIFEENKEEGLELLHYDLAVEQHFFWTERFQVSLVMENFLTKKIDGESFCSHVNGFRYKLIDKCDKFNLELISTSEKIKNFQPDERGKKIIGFLTYLFCECDYFDEDEDSQNEEFYDSIKNPFLEFQKILNED